MKKYFAYILTLLFCCRYLCNCYYHKDNKYQKSNGHVRVADDSKVVQIYRNMG